MSTAETPMENCAENTYCSYLVLLTAQHGSSTVLNLPLVNFIIFLCRWADPNFSRPAFEWCNLRCLFHLQLLFIKIYEYSTLYFVQHYSFVEILSCPTYREESSRLRPLRHCYSFRFRCVTDKIMLTCTLQVYFARSNGR